MSQRARSALSAVLIVLACLLAPAGALASWATYEIGDGGRYEAVTAPLATDPAVREAIAAATTDGIMREVEVTPRLRSPVRSFVHSAVRSFTRTPAFHVAWDTANQAAYDAVMRALRDDDERTVTLDVAPVAAQVKRQLTADHVPFAHRIPVGHAEITVLRSAELARLRKGFHVLEIAGFWLPAVTVALAVAGVLVAVCRRRAVVATGLGTALGAALLAVAVAVGRRMTLSGLPADVSHAAAGAIYDTLTGTLRTVSWLLLAFGLALALGALLTERIARLRRVSAGPAPVPAEEPTRVRA
ncbi:hypothetical protein ACFYP4_13985 [Streptomyces sp. NPDC005551]|uniref:hypothetical protein n=1 Tax=Streptomyces sp. NPDC005551 TaxID=3364725 RepID=UPI0036D18A57